MLCLKICGLEPQQEWIILMSHNICKRDVRDYLGLIGFIIVGIYLSSRIFKILELDENMIPQTNETEQTIQR